MQKIAVVKIGGQVIEDSKLLDAFLSQLADVSMPLILVHGGGKSATQMATKLGVTTVMNDGRRVTDAVMLEIVTMVYGGLANKNIVANLQHKGKNALGLSGADACMIRATKRAAEPFDFGFVGDINPESFNLDFLQLLLNQQIMPVLAPLSYDGKGGLLNTNADTIAANLAIGLGSFYQVQLLYCFEKTGVLTDSTDENTLVRKLNKNLYSQLCTARAVHQGMIPKLKNAFFALENGVSMVGIGHFERLNNILQNNHYTDFTKLEH